jgi:hypothetical protein
MMQMLDASIYPVKCSDGYNTGIYTLESLRELGAEIAPSKN